MTIFARLQERRQQLRAAELHAAECRGIVRGLQMTAKRHQLLDQAEEQARLAQGRAEALAAAVAEIESVLVELQAAEG